MNINIKPVMNVIRRFQSKQRKQSFDINQHPKSSLHKLRKWLKRGWYVTLIFVGIFLIYHSMILYQLNKLRSENPINTPCGRQEIIRQSNCKQVWVPLDNISSNLVEAVVLGEDQQFYKHSGVDWKAIRFAFIVNWRNKRIVRGGSTINQQLMKNLFLPKSKNPLRKLHEYLLAVEAEQILGKRRVMELYLNVIEWGNGVYGAEAAAQFYFKTPGKKLTKDQAAFLAAIIPNPIATYNPSLHPEKVKYRKDLILTLMSKEESIPEDILRKSAIVTAMPIFPNEAKKAGAEGVSISRLMIDNSGNVTKVDVLVAPHNSIGVSVNEALYKWKFAHQKDKNLQSHRTGRISFYFLIEENQRIVRNPISFSN